MKIQNLKTKNLRSEIVQTKNLKIDSLDTKDDILKIKNYHTVDTIGNSEQPCQNKTIVTYLKDESQFYSYDEKLRGIFRKFGGNIVEEPYITFTKNTISTENNIGEIHQILNITDNLACVASTSGLFILDNELSTKQISFDNVMAVDATDNGTIFYTSDNTYKMGEHGIYLSVKNNSDIYVPRNFKYGSIGVYGYIGSDDSRKFVNAPSIDAYPWMESGIDSQKDGASNEFSIPSDNVGVKGIGASYNNVICIGDKVFYQKSRNRILYSTSDRAKHHFNTNKYQPYAAMNGDVTEMNKPCYHTVGSNILEKFDKHDNIGPFWITTFPTDPSTALWLGDIWKTQTAFYQSYKIDNSEHILLSSDINHLSSTVILSQHELPGYILDVQEDQDNNRLILLPDNGNVLRYYDKNIDLSVRLCDMTQTELNDLSPLNILRDPLVEKNHIKFYKDKKLLCYSNDSINWFKTNFIPDLDGSIRGVYDEMIKDIEYNNNLYIMNTTISYSNVDGVRIDYNNEYGNVYISNDGITWKQMKMVDDKNHEIKVGGIIKFNNKLYLSSNDKKLRQIEIKNI